MLRSSHGQDGAAIVAAFAIFMIVGLNGCTLIKDTWELMIVNPGLPPPIPGQETDPLSRTSVPSDSEMMENAETSDPSLLVVESDFAHADIPSVIEVAPSDAERYEAPNGRRLRLQRIETFEDGLIVQDLRDGTGEACAENSMIIVHFHGTLEDGTVVDSTRDSEPRGPWPLAQLMSGWRQGLAGMQVGGVRRLTIPSTLAYGDLAVSDPESGVEIIPAGAALIYVIELIEIQ